MQKFELWRVLKAVWQALVKSNLDCFANTQVWFQMLGGSKPRQVLQDLVVVFSVVLPDSWSDILVDKVLNKLLDAKHTNSKDQSAVTKHRRCFLETSIVAEAVQRRWRDHEHQFILALEGHWDQRSIYWCLKKTKKQNQTSGPKFPTNLLSELEQDCFREMLRLLGNLQHIVLRPTCRKSFRVRFRSAGNKWNLKGKVFEKLTTLFF